MADTIAPISQEMRQRVSAALRQAILEFELSSPENAALLVPNRQLQVRLVEFRPEMQPDAPAPGFFYAQILSPVIGG